MGDKIRSQSWGFDLFIVSRTPLTDALRRLERTFQLKSYLSEFFDKIPVNWSFLLFRVFSFCRASFYVLTFSFITILNIEAILARRHRERYHGNFIISHVKLTLTFSAKIGHFAWWRHFTTMTRILFVFSFIFKFVYPNEASITEALICTTKQNSEGFWSW